MQTIREQRALRGLRPVDDRMLAELMAEEAEAEQRPTGGAVVVCAVVVVAYLVLIAVWP